MSTISNRVRGVGRTRLPLTAVVVLLLGSGLLAATETASTGAPAAAAWEPPPRTVVWIRGNRGEGFVIRRLNGSTSFPPTWSEAMAECAELDTRVSRVRCRTTVRVRYADLGAMKRAIRWARVSS